MEDFPLNWFPFMAQYRHRDHCLFCDRTKLTDEHYLGRWFVRSLDVTTPYRVHTRDYPEVVPSGPGRVTTIRRSTGDPRQGKARVVCKQCNETWMSELQRVAQSVSERAKAMPGAAMLLSTDEQLSLARYAVTTTMVLETLHPNLAYSTEAHRRSFAETLLPPTGWHVWLGRHRGPQWMSFNHFGMGFMAQNHSTGLLERTRHGLQSTAWVVNGLFVMTCFATDFLPDEWAPELNMIIPRIWPNEEICTLPGFYLSDVGADRVSRGPLRVPEQGSRRQWE